MAKILIIEDDQEIALSTQDWLIMENHVVDVVHNGAEGLDRLTHYSYDFVILDIDLPELNGFEICKSYRGNGGAAYILMLTGKDNIKDKEKGLDTGADDYLTKPFHPRELSARIRAIMRRSKGSVSVDDVLTVRDIKLFQKTRIVTKAGEPVQLLPQEFILLQFFMLNPGEVFSQETILNRVWSSESEASPDTVRVHIRKLRSKLDPDEGPSLIKTVHRQGYCLDNSTSKE